MVQVIDILPVLRIRIQLGLPIRIRIREGNEAPHPPNKKNVAKTWIFSLQSWNLLDTYWNVRSNKLVKEV